MIDEISMIPSWMWNILSHIKRQHGFICIGVGDWGQLPPVDEEDIELDQTWVVKYIFNTRWYELTKNDDLTKTSYNKMLIKHGWDTPLTLHDAATLNMI